MFYPKLDSIFDILSNSFFYIFDPSFDDYCDMRFDDINDYFNTRDVAYKEAIKNKNIVDCFKPINREELYLNKNQLNNYISKISAIKISLFRNPELKNNLNGKSVPNFWLNKKIKSVDLFLDLISLFVPFVKKVLLLYAFKVSDTELKFVSLTKINTQSLCFLK